MPRSRKPADLVVSADDLRHKSPEELQDVVDALDQRLISLHQDEMGQVRDKSAAEQSEFDHLIAIRDEANDRIQRHRLALDTYRRHPSSIEVAGTSYRPSAFTGDVRYVPDPVARDMALRALDDRIDTMHMADDEKAQVELEVRRSPDIARRILVTENPDYRSAWQKLITSPRPFLSPDETRAMQAWEEFRTMADFTNSAGGYGIPVFIDPSIILTAQGSGNPFLSIARQVTVNTTVWKGVSSAGVSWAFQTEGAVATDNSPTLAQPTVSVHAARGFIPFSYEVQSDYPNFAQEMSTLLAEGYDELLVDKFTRGSGTGEPKGILTAISATAGDRVKVVTGGTIGAPDPYNVWKALPNRYRRKASWLMSVGVNNAIRQIGAANVYHGYTVNLTSDFADQLMNHPVYDSAYMPDTTTWTTTAECQAIVGDFSNFVIARNGGMSVELVPQLFQQQTAGTGVGYPTAQRGLFAYARIGSDCVNTAAFRVLVANT
jgi:HK97 family phage major capsid protein